MLTFIRQNVNDLIGIGEIGLDFSPHIVGKKGSSMIEDRKEIQKAIFKSQIKLADEFDIMLNVHSRCVYCTPQKKEKQNRFPFNLLFFFLSLASCLFNAH